MDTRTVQSDLLLLLTAVVWGFAFVAQRVGMDYVGPFTFNGVRFALGSLVLVPFILRNGARMPGAAPAPVARTPLGWGAASAGVALFTGASLQQVGIVYTTAGNAGFITGLYVVIVPILGLFWGQRPGPGTWIGAACASVGLYLLCVTGTFTTAWGDLLVLAGAFCWAAHVLIIGWLSPRADSLKLACAQFAVCSVLSLTVAAAVEDIALQGIVVCAVPILYGGILSVGLAYTLQVVAQKHAPPAHAAIILSLEGAFAALGGWIMLEETLSARGITGCAFMLTGMLLSQLWGTRRR